MTAKHKILIVDDESDLRETFASILKKKYEPIGIPSGPQALKFLEKESVSLVLLDIIMPKMNGIETLGKIKELDKNIEVIMITASKDVANAVEAMKLGACDYITKPFETKELLLVIEKTLEKVELRQENLYLRETLKESYSDGDLIGRSPLMQGIFKMIEKVAAANSTILIQGESGTGKEVVARTIHQRSSRKGKPYVVVNCAAIPETLLESEMFGHERGAFSGALERRIGKFELASGGTLFLDEIGCMSPAMQAKLLRVLEDKTIYRVGGEVGIEVDVRIISATNVNFEKAIKEKTFREDLYYRLNVISINLPPLRERKEDIPLFIHYFLEKYNKELNKKVLGFTKEATDLLLSYSWPGNVRELQNLIERLVVLSSGDYISAEELPFQSRRTIVANIPLSVATENFEKEYIKEVLKKCSGNRTQAAKTLGVNRTTLLAKMDALGIV